MSPSRVSLFATFAALPALAWLTVVLAKQFQSRQGQLVVRPVALFVAAGSTLFLLLCWPTGAIDIAELWRFLFFALILFLPILGLRLSRYLRNTWVRKSGIIVTSVLLVPASLFFLLLCVMQAGCTKRMSLPSPDGRHIALLQFALQGALGADYANIYVRKSWWPVAEQVFRGEGGWSPDPQNCSPEVRWLDNSHLLIRYWGAASQGRYVSCQETAGSVKIECRNIAAH